MRGRPGVWARARRLEAAQGGGDLRAEAERLAAELGMGADALLTEAEALAARFRGRRPTLAEMADAAAAEQGLDPEEVRAEAERVLADQGRR